MLRVPDSPQSAEKEGQFDVSHNLRFATRKQGSVKGLNPFLGSRNDRISRSFSAGTFLKDIGRNRPHIILLITMYYYVEEFFLTWGSPLPTPVAVFFLPPPASPATPPWQNPSYRAGKKKRTFPSPCSDKKRKTS